MKKFINVIAIVSVGAQSIILALGFMYVFALVMNYLADLMGYHGVWNVLLAVPVFAVMLYVFAIGQAKIHQAH